MAADNYRFAEGDSLLCYHGPMLYEAKCLKRRKANDGKAQYFIHYKGWNSKWEEWVDDNRVLSVNAANMNKMASLKEIHSNTKKSGGKRSITIVKEETIRNVVTPPIKGKKRKYSEISSELNQSVNVPSPTEPKQKKRGRPPKIVTSKIEENEVTNSVDKNIVTEDDVITESAEPVEENKVIDKITRQDTTKKEDNAKQQDTDKKQDTDLILDSTKKENTIKKYNTTKKENTLKKKDNSIKEDTLNKNATLKKENTPKKKDVPKKEDKPKQIDAPKKEDKPKQIDAPNKEDKPKQIDAPIKEDIPEKVGVNNLMDEATEEILGSIKVEVNKNFEAAKEKKETTKTADEEIKVNAEVENATEELEKTKTIEPCEESKDIKETETIKEVEGTETVERNEDIEESETENVESIENSEVEDHLAEDLEAEDPECEDLEAEELEGEELDGYDGNQEYEETDVDEETASDDDEKCREIVRKLCKITLMLNKARKEAEMANITFIAPAPVIPKINVPDVIKNRITFDFKMVVHNKRFVKFTKKLTIDHLIQDFNNSDPEANECIGLTFIQYFNALIHSRLLYPPEKKNRMMKKAAECFKTYIDDGDEFTINHDLYPERGWHLVYGPSYLIRLFVILPEIVESYLYLESDIVYLVKRFETFMKFIADNFDQYFPEKLNGYCK